MFSSQDIKTIIGLVQIAWQTGNVRSPQEGAVLQQLTARCQQALAPQPKDEKKSDPKKK